MSVESGGRLSRLLTRVAAVEPREAPAVVASFVLFFCVLGGYFAVRPLRETIATMLGRERVADLFLWTWIGAVAIVPIYGWLVARVRRGVLLPCIYGGVAAALAVCALFFREGGQTAGVAETFYVTISVLNLLLVSIFWSFLLELFDSGQAKRLFGVIAAGGTAGALIGPVITDLTVKHVGTSGVLLIGAALFAGAIVAQAALIRVWRGSRDVRTGEMRQDRALGGNPFAGFGLLFRSPYLLGIALFVMLLSAVNTFLYFEQLRFVAETFQDENERTQVFARLDYIVQTLTILSQVFITGRIASKFGITTLLTMVPLVMIVGFLGLAAVGTFGLLAVVLVLRRWGEYAFIRPGREMIWSRLDTETKYKAKNLVDVPVYRGADALTAQFKDAIETAGISAAGAALVGAGFAAAWAINGRWLGRRHDAAAIDTAAPGSAAR